MTFFSTIRDIKIERLTNFKSCRGTVLASFTFESNSRIIVIALFLGLRILFRTLCPLGFHRLLTKTFQKKLSSQVCIVYCFA